MHSSDHFAYFTNPFRPVALRQFFLCLLLVVSCPAISQSSKTGNWFIYFGNQSLNKKWNIWNEVQYRNYNIAGDMQQLLLRAGLGYNLSENNNNLLLGYGYIHSQNYVANTDQKVTTNEHRIFQQFITRQNFGRFFMQHRYRVEERFLPDNFQMRMRYMLSLNLPLNHKKMLPKTLYLSAYNEVFLQPATPVFDRNRLYGALGYMINDNFRVELGFMAQTMERTNRNQFQVVLFNNLSCQKKQDNP
jgi:hypothetical protein